MACFKIQNKTEVSVKATII